MLDVYIAPYVKRPLLVRRGVHRRRQEPAARSALRAISIDLDALGLARAALSGSWASILKCSLSSGVGAAARSQT